MVRDDDPDLSATPDSFRLTADELAFLLGDPAAQTRRAERNARANRARTERRHADPSYAERLRTDERERQRRRRAKAAIGQPEREPSPPAPLPALAPEDALARLTAFLEQAGTPQAMQLRGRAEALDRYVEGFVVYRALAATGERPTRGALAAALKAQYGRSLTPSQIQNLRDRIEGFAKPGGPWHPHFQPPSGGDR
ncbi:hypothetical protein [Azospirillum canadense]|uniref:hypothetical protein n=1 Tax=Azospirillum canadense TaxID=403962 RepID=UPI002227A7F4|nr:hypothetical protein [Azospirillum canadense]MCW2237574.1 hypothetical protein [Azospirillum canadense]